MEKKGLPPSWYGMLVMLLFLGGLFVIPSLIIKTKFVLGPDVLGPSNTVPKTVPIDTPLPVLSGSKLASFTLRSLAATSRNGILVNFWATWCPPCIEELPSLEMLGRQLSQASGSALPKLVTVSVDESPADVTKFFKTLAFPVKSLVLYDKGAALARSVGTSKFPETYWIGAGGKVLFKWVGPQNWLGNDVLLRLHNPPQ